MKETSSGSTASSTRSPRSRQESSPSEEVSSRVKTKTQKEKLVVRRHRQITDAAIRLFDEKGFHGASLRDIGTTAGLTQGTIYNYVESKEDILYLVCDRIVTDYQASFRFALKQSPDSVSRLKLALRAIAMTMHDHRIE